MSICSMAGCSKPVTARGWCHTHYMRWWERGTTNTVLVRDPVDRFWKRVEKTDSCWLWRGAIVHNGYGVMHVTLDGLNTSVRAHRFSYELHVGAIPEGLTLDHLCRVRACVNPSHLEPVTMAENNRRAYEDYVPKPRCIRGHLRTPVYKDGKPKFICTTCRRDHLRRRRAEKRAALQTATRSGS